MKFLVGLFVLVGAVVADGRTVRGAEEEQQRNLQFGVSSGGFGVPDAGGDSGGGFGVANSGGGFGGLGGGVSTGIDNNDEAEALITIIEQDPNAPPGSGGDGGISFSQGAILNISVSETQAPETIIQNIGGQKSLMIPKGSSRLLNFTAFHQADSSGFFSHPFSLRDQSTGTIFAAGTVSLFGLTPNLVFACDFQYRLTCDSNCFLSIEMNANGKFVSIGVPIEAKDTAPALLFMELGPVASETVSTACVDEGIVRGDPHFKTWHGHRFDYHGMCDLVLLRSPEFDNGLGFEFNIRTKLHKQFSYIANAAIRIGDDIFEVGGKGMTYFNQKKFDKGHLPIKFGDRFEITHKREDVKHHVFKIDMREHGEIIIKTYAVFVSVAIESGDHNGSFLDSVGLMGEFGTGRMLGRDGKTLIEDPIAFGEEWQVLGSEPMLFYEVDGPQHPDKCVMPALTAEERRRLSGIDRATAEKACADWPEADKDDCIFDVMATGDLEMAKAGAF